MVLLLVCEACRRVSRAWCFIVISEPLLRSRPAPAWSRGWQRRDFKCELSPTWAHTEIKQSTGMPHKLPSLEYVHLVRLSSLGFQVETKENRTLPIFQARWKFTAQPYQEQGGLGPREDYGWPAPANPAGASTVPRKGWTLTNSILPAPLGLTLSSPAQHSCVRLRVSSILRRRKLAHGQVHALPKVLHQVEAGVSKSPSI